MTSEERAALLGDKLTQAIDAYAAEPSAATLSDYSAELIGRVTSMCAAILVDLIARVERLEARDAAE